MTACITELRFSFCETHLFGMRMAHRLDIVMVDSNVTIAYLRQGQFYEDISNASCQGFAIFPNEGILFEIMSILIEQEFLGQW